jgi:hypothetical protein
MIIIKKMTLFSYLTTSLALSLFFSFESFADWDKIPGAANDIAAGNGDTIWVIGNDIESGGFGIHMWDGHVWTKKNGGAVRIAVDNRGNPWVVNSNGNIFRYRDNAWVLMPGFASDIACGKDGSIWVVGMNQNKSGFNISKWNGRINNWLPVNASGQRISVDYDGKLLIVGTERNIYKYSSGKQILLPGYAMDVGACKKKSSIWVIGIDKEFGGFGIHVWQGKSWAKIPGGAENITVDDFGRAWVVNSDKDIYRFKDDRLFKDDKSVKKRFRKKHK